MSKCCFNIRDISDARKDMRAIRRRMWIRARRQEEDVELLQQLSLYCRSLSE